MPENGSPPTILLAGGSGYVGCRLALHFAELGWNVRIGSRNPAAIPAISHLPVSHVKTDWDDGQSLVSACSGCDHVIHLAAPNEIISGASAMEAINGTVLTTIKLLDAAKAAGVSRFLYFSTAHVYGSPLSGCLDESTNARPSHPYSIAHRCAEDFVLSETKGPLLPIVIRLSNALGAPVVRETDRWKLIGNDLCRQVVEKGEIRLLSDGTALRDFVPIRDVCRAVEFLIESETSEKGILVNVGSGTCRSMREIAGMVAREWVARGNAAPPIHYGDPGGETPPFRFSVDRLLALGFTFQSSLEEEIRATLDKCETWFRPSR